MVGEDFRPAHALEAAARLGARYLNGIGKRRVAPDGDMLRRMASLGGALPENGSQTDEVIELLDQVAAPATVVSAGPRYFGFVTGGIFPAALGANVLAAARDQNAGLRAAQWRDQAPH